MNKTVHLVACPTCKKPNPWIEKNPWRPFCSRRCSDIDLGAWVNEQYKIPAEDIIQLNDISENET